MKKLSIAIAALGFVAAAAPSIASAQPYHGGSRYEQVQHRQAELRRIERERRERLEARLHHARFDRHHHGFADHRGAHRW